MHHRASACLLGASVLALMLAAPAAAQSSADQPTPPRTYNVDGNGVDLVTGKVYFSSAEIATGSGEAGLSYSRNRRELGYDDEYQTALNQSGSVITVSVGLASDRFAAGGGVSQSGTGATLTPSGGLYIYTTAAGVKYEFDSSVRNERYRMAQYRATRISFPSGRVLTIGYDTQLLQFCKPNTGECMGTYFQVSRPSVVSSNDGYRLLFKYLVEEVEGTPSQPKFNRYMTLASAVATNAADAYCTADSCPPGSAARPSVRYAWNTASRQETRTDAMGRVTVTTSDVSDRITGVRLPGEATDSIAITYDGAGRVATFATRTGTWTYGYVDSGNLRTTTVTSPTGLARVAVSDLTAGKIREDRTGNGGTTKYEYDARTRLVRVEAPEHDVTVYGYDNNDNPTSAVSYAKNSTTVSRATYATFDCAVLINCHKPVTTTDAKGQVTNYSYDPGHGGVLSVKRPNAGAGRPEKRFSYQPLYAWYRNAGGTLAQAPSPIWKLTATSECASGEAPACVGTAAETRTEIAYGAAGVPNNLLPTSVTVRSGDGSVASTSGMSYDAVGNVVGTVDPRGGRATLFYNANREFLGRIAPDPDGAGPLKQVGLDIYYRPDGLVGHKQVGTVNPDASNYVSLQQEIYEYDAARRLITRKTAGGGYVWGVTHYSYDAMGRAECTALRMNPDQWNTATSACTAQAAGPHGPDRISRTYYDAAGRVERTVSAVGTADEAVETRLTYTPNGQVETALDANGNKTLYGYDGFDRLSLLYLPHKTATGAVDGYDHEEYGYDANGNMTSRRLRDNRIIAYAYDALNRPAGKFIDDGCALRQVGPCAPASATRDVFYGYDLLGQLTSARFDSQAGEGVSAGWDALGRMTATTTTMGGVSRSLSYQYDAAGNRTRVTHPDGIYFDYAYDVLNRMTNATWTIPGTTVPFMAIAYDDLGRRTDINRASSYTGYSYDAASRLTGMNQRFAGSAGNASTGISAGPSGQVVVETRDNDDYAYRGHVNVDRPYAVNGLNQYTAAGPASFSYDVNGNLISDGGTTYTYDAENRLVSASGGRTASLVYDPLGRLFQTSAPGYVTTQFLYDGDQLVAEYNAANGSVHRRYMHGPGADEPILMDEGPAMNCSGTRFLHTDRLGSVTALADCFGNRVWTNSYDEHGVPGNNLGRFQYTGQAYIPELGLYYYKARMYSPTLGRFLQTDPIGYADGMNWYDYTGGDPVNNTDPTGMENCGPMSFNADTGGQGPNRGPCIVNGRGDRAGTGPWTVTFNHSSGMSWGSGLIAGGGSGGGGSVTSTPVTRQNTCGNGSSDSVRDFLWGAGDVALFGFGDELRNTLGIDPVNMNSTAYTAGEITGSVALLATGVGGGIRAAGIAGRGIEFSHFIPRRMGGSRSIWNGNYVSEMTHIMSDPWRYRFQPRLWKAVNPMPNRASQLWTRTPNTVKGTAAGTGAAGAGLANAGC